MMLRMNEKKSEEQIINKIVALMQSDNSVDAPQDAIKHAKNIFRTRAVEPKKSIVERILAVLQMDLLQGQSAFGERSASISAVRQMFFQAGGNAIDLRITQTEEGLNLHGQILGEGFANSKVKLNEFETTANELSEFKFSGVSNGTYSLILQTEDKEIVVESLELN